MIKNEKKCNTTLLVAGDYHIYGRFDKYITQNPECNIFDKALANVISASDISIFNLEDPIAETRRGIIKTGPLGVGSEGSLLPVKNAGFKVATFATNHTYDMGDQGIIETINSCKKHNIELIGVGLVKEEVRKIYYREVNNLRISILNFSRIEYNEATNYHGGANTLDIINNTRDIGEAKNNSDFVFVIVHEGLDVHPYPYPYLVKQMRFYVDMGADAIIMHHSRIISGFEIYNNRPIFYGIGNLLHLTRNKAEHEGLFIKFLINKQKKIVFELLPIQLDENKVLVSLCDESRKSQILQIVKEKSIIIKDEHLLNTEWKKFIDKNTPLYLSILSGYPRLLYRIAKKFNLLTLYKRLLIINKKKYLAQLNIIKCQAHYEATKEILSSVFKEEEK